MQQTILTANEEYKELDEYLDKKSIKRILLVCGKSIFNIKIWKYFEQLEGRKKIKVFIFSNFKPNPLYESVEEGVDFLKKNKCDGIIAVGGGSAIDVAKCIKLFCNMSIGVEESSYLEKQIVPNKIPFLAVPTTAGTGSEATRFAVIYLNDEKQSVSDFSCIPDAVLFDSTTLETLPDYQRKVTMLDALCHSLESYWSINSTEESRQYSSEAICLIWNNLERYLNNDPRGNQKMMEAANLAGKAINITQTTAGHAMSYKLTGLYGIAHGHAVMLCVIKLWSYMNNHLEDCVDFRGTKYLGDIFDEISKKLGCMNSKEVASRLQDLYEELDLNTPKAKEQDFQILKSSVNIVRLKNNPIKLTEDTIERLYRQMLKVEEGKENK